MIRLRTVVWVWLFCVILLSGCQNDSATPTLIPTAVVPTIASTSPTASVPETVLPPPSPTSIPPTPTPTEPIVAKVNGVPIFLATYERELARYEQAQIELGGAVETDNSGQVVLEALIEKALILQAADVAGVAVTTEVLAGRLEELRAAAGEAGNYEAWLTANQWSEAEFEAALRDELIIEAMVVQVTSAVPTAVEQVRARYIQLDDAETANSLLVQLQNGDDFALRAEQFSLDQATSQTGGDLGYFARGSLLVPEVETAAFALQGEGDLSDVVGVTNEAGQTTYYIVQLMERDPERPLPADLRYTLLDQVFREWLDQQRAAATIEQFGDVLQGTSG